MGKFMKTGKVVLVLGGRFAGRKAVIVKVLILHYFWIYIIDSFREGLEPPMLGVFESKWLLEGLEKQLGIDTRLLEENAFDSVIISYI